MAGTRKVRMVVGVSGYRHDGEKWPPVGSELTVPDWEADDLIRGGNAVAADEDRETHDGERVPAWTPAGTEVSARPASAEEVMTGLPAGHEVTARHDPRPPSQVLAEDYDEGERERIDAGETAVADADDKPAGERAEGRAKARKEVAGRRHADRQRALAYAEDGISGAPGSEVPAHEGKAPVQPEGVRPLSQVEAEDAGRAADESDWAVAERESRMAPEGDNQVTSRENVAAGPEVRTAHGGSEAGDKDSGHGVEHVMAPVAETPAPGDPKQAWVDYAVASGAGPDEAAAMTKADLMSRYGGRL